jgi:hypothetical protein
MPAVSKRQFRFMQMIAHNKEKAKQYGISQEKAREFIEANKGKMAYHNLPESKEYNKKFKKIRSYLKGK